jgi:soluble lytic murein transglycosylase-like protein
VIVDDSSLTRLRTVIWPVLEQGYGLNSGILSAIADWETRGTYNNAAVSRSNAKGIFQLTPIALKQIKIDTGQDISPTNIYSASLGAALLLARYKKLFSNQIPLMVAAYNAGEGTVKKFLRDTASTGKGFLPIETKIYILNVVPMVA